MQRSTDELQIQATMTDLTMSQCGFATLPDGKQIFLPSSVVRASGANIGDTLTCKVVPNYDDRRSDSVPWRAFYVQKIREPGAADMAAVLPEGTEADILQNLREEGPATVGQLLFDLFEEQEPAGENYPALANLLHQMFREGKVAKAQIFKPGSARAKYTFFSADVNDLLPTEEAALPDMS